MNVLTPGDATAPATVTTVRYPPGAQAQAATVAATVPGATITPDPTVTTVTLVLGTDGLTPGGSTSAAASALPSGATGAPAVDAAGGGLACID